MLTEADIVPGRNYLCRTNMPTIRGPHAGEREVVVLRAGSKQETAQGPKSELTLGGFVIGWVDDGSTEVLRELDLEAMAAECETHWCATCLGSGWTQGGFTQCMCCGGAGRAKTEPRWSDEVEAEIERVAE